MRDSEASDLKPRGSHRPEPQAQDAEAESGVLPKASAIDEDLLDTAVTIPAPRRASIQPFPVLAIGPAAPPHTESPPAEASPSAEAIDALAAAEPESSSQSAPPSDDKRASDDAPEIEIAANDDDARDTEVDAAPPESAPRAEPAAPPIVAEARDRKPSRRAKARSTRPRDHERTVEHPEPKATRGVPILPALLVVATIGTLAILHRSRPESSIEHAQIAPTVATQEPARQEPPAATAVPEPQLAPILVEAPAPVAAPVAAAQLAPPSDTAQPVASAASPLEPTNAAAATESARLTAYRAVVLAGTRAQNCRFRGDGPATVPVVVTFGADGAVQSVILRRGLANPMTQSCITSKFAGLSIPASGTPVTVSTDVSLH